MGVLVLVVLLGIGWMIFLSTFTLFEVKEEKVMEIVVEGKGYRLGVFYSLSNATAQSTIQVRKIGKNGDEVLANYERYNFVAVYRMIGGDTLELILQDTMLSRGGAPDTVYLPLDD